MLATLARESQKRHRALEDILRAERRIMATYTDARGNLVAYLNDVQPHLQDPIQLPSYGDSALPERERFNWASAMKLKGQKADGLPDWIQQYWRPIPNRIRGPQRRRALRGERGGHRPDWRP